MKRLCIITARGGSKRIPHKNIKDFIGKPIIAYVIEAAKQSGLFSDIMVSTDDKQIAQIAKQYGADVPFMRSAKTSDDYASTRDVLEEVLLKYQEQGKIYDAMCCIYPTAPLIEGTDIIKAYNLLMNSNFDCVYPVVAFSYPIWRCLDVEEDGSMKRHWPEYENSRSQDLPIEYHDSGSFYWYKLQNGKIMGKRVGAIIVSEDKVQDIDNETDWKLAELKYNLLAKDNKYDIKKDGFIISFFYSIFNALRQVSLFQQVRNFAGWRWMLLQHQELKGLTYSQKKQQFSATQPFVNSYLFSELWVAGTILCGILIYTLMANCTIPDWLQVIFICFALLRAFEIMIYHINVLLFDPIRADKAGQKYVIKSPTRMLLLLMINMVEYMLCFSIVFLFFAPDVLSTTSWQSFAFSASAFLNLDVPEINLLPNAILHLAHIESIVGVLMNIICIARFIGTLPSVRTIEKY